MPFSVELIKRLEAVDPTIREVLIALLEEVERQREESITRKEFLEFAKRTEESFQRVWEAIERLTKAQEESERRIGRLETAVQELAEAQKKTEEELRKLIGEHKKTREELGGLSHTVGYILEDRAYLGLPELIKRDFGIEIEEIKRDFIEISPNRYEEINLLGKGKKNGSSIWILGECKTQLKKRDIDLFLKKLSRIEHLFPGEKIFVVVTYQASPQVRQYIEEKGIKLYFSYQLKVLM